MERKIEAFIMFVNLCYKVKNTPTAGETCGLANFIGLISFKTRLLAFTSAFRLLLITTNRPIYLIETKT